MGEQLGACDNALNPERRRPHGLRAVERRVLKGSEPDESIDEPGGKSFTLDIDLVRQHSVDALGQGNGASGLRREGVAQGSSSSSSRGNCKPVTRPCRPASSAIAVTSASVMRFKLSNVATRFHEDPKIFHRKDARDLQCARLVKPLGRTLEPRGRRTASADASQYRGRRPLERTWPG